MLWLWFPLFIPFPNDFMGPFPLFPASSGPAVRFTLDALHVVSLRTWAAPAGEEASDGNGAAESDEPWEKRFHVNIADDHYLNKNTTGVKRHKEWSLK